MYELPKDSRTHDHDCIQSIINICIPRQDTKIPICTCSSILSLSKMATHIPGQEHMYELKKPENAKCCTQNAKRNKTNEDYHSRRR